MSPYPFKTIDALDAHSRRVHPLRSDPRKNYGLIRSQPMTRSGVTGEDPASLEALQNRRDPDPGGHTIKQHHGDAFYHHHHLHLFAASASHTTMENQDKIVSLQVGGLPPPRAIARKEGTTTTATTTTMPTTKALGDTAPAHTTTRQQAKEKEVVQEMGIAKEKKVIMWNVSKLHGINRTRYMVVGVFLSILTISTKTLLDNMKRIW